MKVVYNSFLNQDDDLKSKQNNDVSADNDDIGENTEQTPLAQVANSDEEEKNTKGSEGGGGWKNDRPGQTKEQKDEKLIPIVGKPGTKSI